MTQMSKHELMIAAADELAERAHAGQFDKAGNPYIEHPRAVAAMFDPDAHPNEVVVSLLHDVIEDTEVTLNDLHRMFPSHIVAAVDAITIRAGETREAYYQRTKKDPLAKAVKLRDIAHNADPSRLALLDKRTRSRLEAKYAKARQALA